MRKLTHLNENGELHMVDVGCKEPTERIAVASGTIHLSTEAMKQLLAHDVAKGSVLSVSRVAAIQAAKKTSDIIPLCHPLPLTKIVVDFEIDDESNHVNANVLVKTYGVTGVEMEALTGVSVALLTIYDMLKAVDKGMLISDIKLLEKQGGKSGTYLRD